MSNLSESPTPERNESHSGVLRTELYKPKSGSGLLPIREPRASGQVSTVEPQEASRALLWLRLRLLCILGFGGWAIFDVVLFAGRDPVIHLGVVPSACAGLILLTTAAPLIFVVLLSIRPGLSAGGLRAIEASLVCLCAVSLAWIRYSTLDHTLAAAGTATGLEGLGILYASAFNNLCLLCVVVTFGVVIPNRWGGTLLVVVALALVSLSAEVVCWYARFPAGNRYFLSSASMTVLTLFIGAGVTVFVSFRTAQLQGQVSEARRLLREFGQYRLSRRLGSGGMGEVYLAEHRLLKRPCAIKLIRSEKAADERFVKRFEREVAAATRLAHPAAVQVYDYGRAADGSFYYAMEYLPGLTLDAVVQRSGPLPPARVVHVLRQIYGVLRAAHLLGLVHRDVKPGNVMLCRFEDRTDVAKLLDFGLVGGEAAGDDGRLTQTGAILGTPAYMSPEQAQGADAGPTADLYSLGAVGFYLLTGRPPFVGRNTLELLHAHLVMPVPSPSAARPGVPTDLEDVILRLLAKESAHRFASATELDAALGACRCARDWTEADASRWWESPLATDPSIPANKAQLQTGTADG